LIDKNRFSRPGDKLSYVKGIVWHYTANPGASDTNHQDYFDSLQNQNPYDNEKDLYASAHIFIDKDSATMIIPLDERAYHAGNSFYNSHYIGIELCIEKDGSFHPNTVKQAIAIGAHLCKTYKLNPLVDNIRHFDVTGKICPKPWVDSPALFTAFKNDVKRTMAGEVYEKVNIYDKSGKKIAEGELRDGVTWVPLRVVAESTGATVNYNAVTKTVTIIPKEVK